MKRISANYIIPIASEPIRNGIIETEDDGTIRKIYNFGGEMRELAHTQFLNGVLVPGLINMHTHLELAGVKRVIPKQAGLAHFISELFKNRTPENIKNSITQADDFMYRRGIVAACDISNTTNTVETKIKSKILYHTIVEISGLQPQNAQKRMQLATEVYKSFIQSELSAAISPHAPYSISARLWGLISKSFGETVISMHNQESTEENKMFIDGTGELVESFKALNIMDKRWIATGRSSFLSIAEFLKNTKLLLVHNTHTTQKEINWLIENKTKPTGFVLCPTSNMHIDGRLPDIETLQNSNLPIMLGTDSVASGKSLSLLDEMLLLQKEAQIPFRKLIAWSTEIPAQFMNWPHLGNFTPGKKPGINLITNFDFENFKLKENSQIKRIL